MSDLAKSEEIRVYAKPENKQQVIDAKKANGYELVQWISGGYSGGDVAYFRRVLPALDATLTREELDKANRIAQLANILAEVVESVWDHLGTTRCKELQGRLDEIYREQIAIAVGRTQSSGYGRSPGETK